MGSKKTSGIILLVVGIPLLILSLLLDPIGLGRSPEFGMYQIAGTIVGAIMTIIGVRLTVKK